MLQPDLPVLTGTGLSLRPMTRADTSNIVRWRNLEDVRSQFIYREPFTAEMHTGWIENMVLTGRVAQFIIVDSKSGLDVGSAYLRDIDRKNQKAEFGIFIGEAEARGRGLGTEAARLLSDYALGEMGLNKVFLRLLVTNPAARRAYERAGFVSEGIMRRDVFVDGSFIDVEFMARLREEK